jgi:ribonuclease HII
LDFPNFQYEIEQWGKGFNVAGVDEAGRGCLAGPVVASAVVLPIFFDKEYEKSQKHFCLINDSKKLTRKKRDECYDFIFDIAVSIGIAIVDSSIIDKINILQSSVLAMNLAINKLNASNLSLLIDGNYFKSFQKLPFRTIVHGDAISFSIAAASIISKVTRDRFVSDYLHCIYPNYAFNEHFGYATKKHFAAIDKYGITIEHRKSFLIKYTQRKNNNEQATLF